MSAASILAGTPSTIASTYGGPPSPGGGSSLPTVSGSGTGTGAPQTIIPAFSSADNGVYVLYLTDSTQPDNFCSAMYCVVGSNCYEMSLIAPVPPPPAPQIAPTLAVQFGAALTVLNIPNGDAYAWKYVKVA